MRSSMKWLYRFYYVAAALYVVFGLASWANGSWGWALLLFLVAGVWAWLAWTGGKKEKEFQADMIELDQAHRSAMDALQRLINGTQPPPPGDDWINDPPK